VSSVSQTHPLDPSRTLVVGTSGSGKTTFAAALAKRLGYPHIELDAFFWKPCPPRWESRGAQEFTEGLAPEIARECWIADGNHRAARDLLIARATCVIWLRYPLPLVFARALRRTVRRVATREPSHGGNVETFAGAFLSFDGIPWWVLRMHRRRTWEFTDTGLRARVPVHELQSPAQAAAFLHEVGSP